VGAGCRRVCTQPSSRHAWGQREALREADIRPLLSEVETVPPCSTSRDPETVCPLRVAPLRHSSAGVGLFLGEEDTYLGCAHWQEELLERYRGQVGLLQRQVQWLQLEVRETRASRVGSLCCGDDGSQRSPMGNPLDLLADGDARRERAAAGQGDPATQS